MPCKKESYDFDLADKHIATELLTILSSFPFSLPKVTINIS